MQATEYTDVSLACMKFLLNFTGLSVTVNRDEERRRKCVLVYTVIANLYCIYLSIVDIYHTTDDLSHCIFGLLNVLCMILILVKISIMTYNRKGFLDIVFYAQQNFWHLNYSDQETVLYRDCEKFCKMWIITICVFCQASLSGYVVTPLWMNIGRNKSDRLFPFAIWADLPVTVTPYYEIIFTFQVMCVYQIGCSYICSDVCLCVVIMHVICQFRMLQHRISNLWSVAKEQIERKDDADYGNKCYIALKKCIQEHQSLIEFCDKLEHVYTFVILGHMVVFSLLMCLDTFQMLLGNVPTTTRIIFIFHMIGSFIHIIFFTYTCHGLIEESTKVTVATYSGWWTILPMNNTGKMLRKDIQMMIMRSLRPCCLTAGGFFPVSLETSTALVSSTVSYFTLMRETAAASGNE